MDCSTTDTASSHEMNAPLEEAIPTQPPWDLDALLHRWFVLYNPLYFISALLVLSGLWGTSRDLRHMDWQQGKLLLAATTQLYEGLLIAAAAFVLHRCQQRRPAVILGLTAVFFGFDPAFHNQVIACFEGPRAMYALVWILLAMAKWWALSRVFDLRLAPIGWGILVALASALALGPQLVDWEGLDREGVLLAITWGWALLLALWHVDRPVLVSSLALGTWGETVLRRANNALWGLGFGCLWMHWIAWKVVHDIPLGFVHFVPFVLLVVLVARLDLWIWGGAALALGMAFEQPSGVAATGLLVAILLAWRARKLDRPRLWLGSVTALYLALRTFAWHGGPFPDATWWMQGALVLTLAVLAWRLRLWSALLLGGAALVAMGDELTDLVAFSWGVGALMAGFLSLGVGVFLDWRRRLRPLP